MLIVLSMVPRWSINLGLTYNSALKPMEFGRIKGRGKYRGEGSKIAKGGVKMLFREQIILQVTTVTYAIRRDAGLGRIKTVARTSKTWKFRILLSRDLSGKTSCATKPYLRSWSDQREKRVPLSDMK